MFKYILIIIIKDSFKLIVDYYTCYSVDVEVAHFHKDFPILLQDSNRFEMLLLSFYPELGLVQHHQQLQSEVLKLVVDDGERQVGENQFEIAIFLIQPEIKDPLIRLSKKTDKDLLGDLLVVPVSFGALEAQDVINCVFYLVGIHCSFQFGQETAC